MTPNRKRARVDVGNEPRNGRQEGQAAEIEVIFPDGDVILVAGRMKQHILVHSAVLSCASGAFTPLLGNRFQVCQAYIILDGNQFTSWCADNPILQYRKVSNFEAQKILLKFHYRTITQSL